MNVDLTKPVYNFLECNEKLKKAKDEKKELETLLKSLLEENNVNSLEVNNKKISYTEVTRKIKPKIKDVILLFQECLLDNDNTKSFSDDIMELFNRKLEQKNTEKTTKTIKISKLK